MQTAIVVLIVVLAMAYMARRIWLARKGGASCCSCSGCGGSGSCPGGQGNAGLKPLNPGSCGCGSQKPGDGRDK